jgi:hypothetical protein
MVNLFGFSKKKCPYCGFAFSENPKRSKVCPSCNKKFYVQKGQLITEIQKLRNDVIYFLGNFYDPIAGEKLFAQYGVKRSKYDYIHTLLNSATLKEKSGKNDPVVLGLIYGSMIINLRNKGSDPSRIYPIYSDEIRRSVEKDYACLPKEEREEMLYLLTSLIRQ